MSRISTQYHLTDFSLYTMVHLIELLNTGVTVLDSEEEKTWILQLHYSLQSCLMTSCHTRVSEIDPGLCPNYHRLVWYMYQIKLREILTKKYKFVIFYHRWGGGSANITPLLRICWPIEKLQILTLQSKNNEWQQKAWGEGLKEQ